MLEINQVYNLDCIEGMSLLDNESIDLLLTDPPYDVGYDKKSEELNKIGKGRQKQIDRDKNYIEASINYIDFCQQLFRVMKNDTHIYIFCSSKQIKDWILNMENSGFKFIQILIWQKNRPTFDMTRGYKYSEIKEQILFFMKGWKRLNINNKYPTSILKFNVNNSNKFHPTERPMDLLYKLIELSSNKGDLILKTFAGSGNHLLDSQNKERNFIGFELSKGFYEQILVRLKLQPQKLILDKEIEKYHQKEDWLKS